MAYSEQWQLEMEMAAVRMEKDGGDVSTGLPPLGSNTGVGLGAGVDEARRVPVRPPCVLPRGHRLTPPRIQQAVGSEVGGGSDGFGSVARGRRIWRKIDKKHGTKSSMLKLWNKRRMSVE